MVSAHKVDLRLLDQFPDVGGFQVRDLVLVRGGKVRDHTSVVAGDDDAAAAGGSGGVDEVFGAEAGGSAGGAEGVGVGVGADAADVENGGRGENVLVGRRGSVGKGFSYYFFW